jgi:hypothetical protein
MRKALLLARLVGCVALAAFAWVWLARPVPPPTPSTLVAELYRRHDAGTGPFQDPSRAGSFFVPALAAGIRRDAQSPAGQVGRLDFDPLHDAQDFAVHDFRLADEDAPGGSDRARVRAAYRDGDHAVEVVFELSRREPEGWRIEDIRYGRGRSLSELLRSP